MGKGKGGERGCLTCLYDKTETLISVHYLNYRREGGEGGGGRVLDKLLPKTLLLKQVRAAAWGKV